MGPQQAIGLVLATGGFVALSYGLRLLWLASSSPRWAVTDGVVLEAAIRAYRDLSSGVGAETYRPVMRYRYKAGSQQYESSRVAFGDFVRTQFRRSVARLVNASAPGSIVRVYYDPSSPERAVLQPGRNWALYVLPIVALLPLVVGLLMALGW